MAKTPCYRGGASPGTEERIRIPRSAPAGAECLVSGLTRHSATARPRRVPNASSRFYPPIPLPGSGQPPPDSILRFPYPGLASRPRILSSDSPTRVWPAAPGFYPPPGRGRGGQVHSQSLLKNPLGTGQILDLQSRYFVFARKLGKRLVTR